MPSRRLPVAAKIVLAYLAGAALFSAALIHWLVTGQHDQLVAEVAKKGEAVTRLFARSITTALYHLDVHLIQDQISHVTALQDVGEVVVLNERGQCVTDGSQENPRLGDVEPGATGVLARGERKPLQDVLPDRLRYTSAVILGERPIGGVRLDFSLETVAAQVKTLRDRLVLLALCLSLAGALPVWLVSQYFVKPLLFGDE